MSFLGPSIAIAYGNRQNCAFHCIAHTWLSLPKAKIKELYNKSPIYKTIIEEFYAHYNSPVPDNIDRFIDLMKTEPFSHPKVREWVWGQILRKVARDLLVREGRELPCLANGLPVEITDLLPLINQMGAKLEAHPAISFDNALLGRPRPDFQIELFHKNAHYNFSFGDRAQNEIHNKLIDAPLNQRQKEFEKAAQSKDVKEQVALMIPLVRSYLTARHPAPAAPAGVPVAQPQPSARPASAAQDGIPVSQEVYVAVPAARHGSTPAQPSAREDDLARAIELSRRESSRSSASVVKGDDLAIARAIELSLRDSSRSPASSVADDYAIAMALSEAEGSRSPARDRDALETALLGLQQRDRAPSVPAAAASRDFPRPSAPPAPGSAQARPALTPAQEAAARNLQIAQEAMLARAIARKNRLELKKHGR